MVSVDENLKGIQMWLRESMQKFEVKLEEGQKAMIEVARAFDRPNPTYLNRSVSFSVFLTRFYWQQWIGLLL